MEAIFTAVKYLFAGFFGLIGFLFVAALLFGKRIVKSWEYEAKFRDDAGKEFGEFEIELSRVAGESEEETFKAEFKLRHKSLEAGACVQVYLDDILVMQGIAETAGRVRLVQDHVQNTLAGASRGQVCRVVYGGLEQFRQEIVPD